MDPVHVVLRLALAVLPLFINASQRHAKQCASESRLQAYYVRIESVLATSNNILTDLHQRSLGASLPQTAQDRLFTLLTKLLDLLERTTNAHPTPGQAGFYPKLRNLRKPGIQSRHDACGLLRFQRQALAEKRKRFLLILDKGLLRLVNLVHTDPAMQSYLADSAPESQEPSSNDLSLAENPAELDEVWLIDEREPVLLHQAIADRWVCQCPSRHKAKLRLTSCYFVGPSGKGAKFDMMMMSTQFGQSQWQRACVQLSRHEGRSVQFASCGPSSVPTRDAPSGERLAIRPKAELDPGSSADVSARKERYPEQGRSSRVASISGLSCWEKNSFTAAVENSSVKSPFRSFCHKGKYDSTQRSARFTGAVAEAAVQDVVASMQQVTENVNQAGSGAANFMADWVDISRGGICRLLQRNAQRFTVSLLASRTSQGLSLSGGYERSRSSDRLEVIPLSRVLHPTHDSGGGGDGGRTSHDARDGDFELLNTSTQSKLILANVLAHAVMQLYGSPWTNRRWNKDRLSFALEPSRHKSLNAFVELYLSSELDEQQSQSLVDSLRSPHPHPRLLDLGIMLLEIELETSIEEERQLDDLGDGGQLLDATDLLVADRLSRSNRLSTSFSDYRNAITACVNAQECVGQDLNFVRGWIKRKIVQPLSRLLWNCFNMSITSDGIHQDGRLLRDVRIADARINIPDLDIDSEEVPTDAVERGHFLDCEKHFAVDSSEKSQISDWWFEQLTKITIPHLNTLKKQQTSPAVPSIRIAILDTGIDARKVRTPRDVKTLPSHPALKAYAGRIVDFGTWYGDALDETSTEMKDHHGHGTHAAALILKIAPHAHLYVAQIDRGKDVFEPNPLSIAEAIKHATDVWKVDIITMSFGFQSPDSTIYEAIQHAYNHNVIMFAAASNGGMIFGETFPATCEEVISIRSADGYGRPSKFNPGLSRDSLYAHFFNVIGENVLSAWPAHLDTTQTQQKRQTGSSVATPIAAAVVALFLEYIRVRACYGSHRDEVARLWQRIRYRSSASGIRAALKLMSDKDNEGSLYFIMPWLLMAPDASERWERLRKM